MTDRTHAYPAWADPNLGLVDLLEGLERHRRTHGSKVAPMDAALILGRVGERLGSDGDPLRVRAIAALIDEAGYSPQMAAAVLHGMARDWTVARLQRVVEAEFGSAGAPWAPISPAVHVSSGSVPGVSVTTLIRGLLVGSAVLLKPGRGDIALPVLYHEALARESPAMAGAAAVHYWSPDDDGVEAVMARAGLIVAYGGDEAIRWVRSRAAPSARLVEYPHRISVLVIDPRGATPDELERGAADAALAVALYEQRGCVSPHAAFVVHDDRTTPENWAALLADALDRLSVNVPRGRRTPAEASAFHQEAGVAEVSAAAGSGTEIWGAGMDWRVVYEPRQGFMPSCLGRFIRVYPVASPTEAAERLSGLAPHLQSVGLVGDFEDADRRAFFDAGALRVTSAVELPWPAAWAHHDGVRPLRTLVRWLDSGS